jgi:hypothetical protein
VLRECNIEFSRNLFFFIFWGIVDLERGSLSLLRKLRRSLTETLTPPVWEAEVNSSGDPSRGPRDTPLSGKVGIDF